ncbi:unnamed protein product, partial [Prunus brigantina]
KSNIHGHEEPNKFSNESKVKQEKRHTLLNLPRDGLKCTKKGRKIGDSKENPAQKKNPSSSSERVPFERRRDDEVESDRGLSSQRLEMGDFCLIALSHLV